MSPIKSTEPTESGVLPPWVGSIPPVSTTVKERAFHSASPKRRSRVVPGVSSTIAIRSPTRRLNSVDLPTLGRPTSATMGFIGLFYFMVSGLVWVWAYLCQVGSKSLRWCLAGSTQQRHWQQALPHWEIIDICLPEVR